MKKYLLFALLIAQSFSISSFTIKKEGIDLPNRPPAVKDCKNIDAVIVILAQAIESGAPTYNEENHLACYLIYEGAAYKILYKYGSKCADVKNTLETALAKSYGNYSATDKAWIMRAAFDKILGEPTKTKDTKAIIGKEG